jgi:hypothetical protein
MKCFLTLDDWNSEVLIPDVSGALENCVLHFPNFKVNLMCSGALTIPINPHPDKYAYLLHGWSHRFWDEVSDEELEKWPYDKGYRAPYWQLTDVMRKRLIDHGYKILTDLGDEDGIPWNWGISHAPDLTKEVLVGMGHITRSVDNIADCIKNVFMLPKDTEFSFIRDWGKDVH